MTTLVQGPTSVTSENPLGTQLPSDIVGLTSGGYVVTWTDQPDSGGSTIRARVYDATGRTTSRELTIGSGTMSSVTALVDGGFAIAFEQLAPENPQNSSTTLSLQSFDASGAARGNAILLDAAIRGPSTSAPVLPFDITGLSNGKIAVAWSNGGVTVGRIVESNGSPSSGLLQLGSDGATTLSISSLANGGFAIARSQYAGFVGLTPLSSVDARFYDASGQPTSSTISLASRTVSTSASTSALADGRLVVGYGGVGFRVVSPDGILGSYYALGPGGTSSRDTPGEINLATSPDGTIIARYRENNATNPNYVTKRVSPNGEVIENLAIGGNYPGDIASLSNGSIALAQTLSENWYDVTTTVYRATDILIGTAGDDLIRAGAGFNRIDGLAGSDTIFGGRDTDLIAGGIGSDLIYGQGGDDQIIGEAGDDTVYGGAGNDYAAGNAGQDVLFGGEGNDFLVGEAGVDVLFGNQGNDFLSGGDGDDFVFGDLGDDLVDGDGGNDYVNGGAGNDVVNGDDGNDTLAGELGNDTLLGGAGSDLAFGNEGADVIYGGLDSDALFGGDGNDLLYGGDGDDLIAGDFGSDTMIGGGGADLYALSADAGSADLILGFNQAEGDRILLAPGQTYTVGTTADGNALLVLSSGGTVELAGIQAANVNQSYFAS